MDNLSELLLALYSASREASLEEFQELALSLSKPRVPFDSAIWGIGTLTRAGLAYNTVHLHNEPDDLALEYEEVRLDDEAAFQIGSIGVNTMRFHAPTLFQGRNKSGIRRYAARFGHQNYIMTSEIKSETNAAHWISLYRARRQHEYTEDEVHSSH